jgi:hypothetical protein
MTLEMLSLGRTVGRKMVTLSMIDCTTATLHAAVINGAMSQLNMFLDK